MRRGHPGRGGDGRPHRLWAATCATRVYTGSWELRTFASVCTGFLLLPVLNWIRGRPAWQIFVKGPLTYPEEFLLVSDFDHMHTVHSRCEKSLSWLTPDGHWPATAEDIAAVIEAAPRSRGPS